MFSDDECAYNQGLGELRLSDRNEFMKYLRMNEETFEELLEGYLLPK